MAKELLIIAHEPSDNTAALARAAFDAANDFESDDLTVRLLSPFDVKTEDVVTANGIIIGTTENIGYMAGATKDMFDRCYNDWIDICAGKPVGLYIRAGLDGTATTHALNSIFTGLRWRIIAPPLVLHGTWNTRFINDVAELSMAMAAGLDAGIF
ncbi:flavodoxin family protein [Alphaproteobacteria bacterium]|nr:flavodoxin family protein [Alphaproteobacteria bacterium]